MRTEYTDPVPGIQTVNSLFENLAAPVVGLKISVIVPAQNEAENINKTLEALRLQTDENGNLLDPTIYEVLLLANNCTDQTFWIAKNYQLDYPEFQLHIAEISIPPENANIGYVRRILMDEACNRLMYRENTDGIIASTDGDTEVDSCWIYHILNEIKNGCEAVGGRILTYSNNCASRLYYLKDVAYRSLLARAESIIDPETFDPWPRHFQYFGASMAVTCNVYQQVGRLPQVPYLEDSAFYEALLRMDIRVRKSPVVKAYTSARLSGRVEIGFSEQLKKWSGYEESGHKQEVEPVGAMLTKFRCRKILKQLRGNYLSDGFYNQKELQDVADALFIDQKWLSEELAGNLYFGKLWENVRYKLNNKDWAAKWNLVPIGQAISELRIFINKY